MGKVKLQYKTAAMRDAAKQIIQDKRRRPAILCEARARCQIVV